jgi:hypothetical protein
MEVTHNLLRELEQKLKQLPEKLRTVHNMLRLRIFNSWYEEQHPTTAGLKQK